MTIQHVEIKKLNESYAKVVCSESYIEMEIQDKFSFLVPDYKHDPRVKRGHWDGYKRLYNRANKTFPIGLVLPLLRFLKSQKYTYTLDKSLIPNNDISIEDIKSICEEIIDPHDNGKPISLYDHQLDAVHHMLSLGRSLCLSSTSSGKSLIIYTALRILQLLPELEDKKFFVVVPSGHLVEQMYSDFENYANGSTIKWSVGKHCQKISKDYKKSIDRQIVITTWQSLKNIPRYALDSMAALFVDEVHGAKADVLSRIISDSIYCPMKHGLTGSLDGFESNEMFIEGMFGPRKVIMTAKESIDKGVATPIKVNSIILKYSDSIKKDFAEVLYKTEDGKKRNSKEWYSTEKDFVYSLEQRKKFIKNLALSLEGNTLILFDTIDKYQIPIYEMLKEEYDEVYLINGDVSNEERDKIKARMEKGDKKIITLATYGTMAVGVSIKNMKNMIFASSTKAMIRIIQSIGRLMRKHANKNVATIYDVVDDLSMGRKYQGYMISHGKKRVKIYADERHPVKFYPVEIK